MSWWMCCWQRYREWTSVRSLLATSLKLRFIFLFPSHFHRFFPATNLIYVYVYWFALIKDVLHVQGTSTDVPRYLRADGQINNKKMNRQELEELVTGFWEFRTLQVAQGGGGRDSTENALDELLYSYLLQRSNGQETVAIEDGYNLQVCVYPVHC